MALQQLEGGTRRKPRFPLKTPSELKDDVERRKKKRARLVVRNVSFKADENKLKEHFSEIGALEDVNIVRRLDGSMVGCAFVQYATAADAAKAILKLNSKPFMGRPVYIDWAVGKDLYDKKKLSEDVSVKTEDVKNVSVKDEDDDELECEIKEDDENSEVQDDVKSEKSDSEDSDSEDEDDEDDEEDVENNKDADNSGVESDNEEKEVEDKKPKRNDIVEGCTVFIKNVPMDATDQDLGKCCKQFGAIYYCLVNRDKVSGHSRGTGFVKFKSKDSADMCLKAGTEFRLQDEILDPVPALSREDVKEKASDGINKNPADTRNLYLVKEGVIIAGTKAAEGVSPSDMAKRLKLEQVKTQILKNLSRFISRDRLSIHNLPGSYTNEKLLRCIERNTQLKPKECRVMRENKPTAGHPQGKSKGFGFIAFRRHEDALKCLRKLNNNPTVFGKTNRPIVSFSIEDKTVHGLKEKRLQKSREKNPTYVDKSEKLKAKKLARKERKKKQINDKLNITQNEAEKSTEDKKPDAKKVARKLRKKNKKLARNGSNVETSDGTAEMPAFSGLPSTPGASAKSRPQWKLREQAQVHKDEVGAKKREKRLQREKFEHLREKKQVERPKQGKRKIKDRDDFSKMVNHYKTMLDAKDDAKPPKKKKKWYTD